MSTASRSSGTASILDAPSTLDAKAMATRCERARRLLVLDHPVSAALAMRLPIVAVEDHRVPTSTTDGATIFVGVDHVGTLDDAELAHMIARESWRAALGEPMRGGGRPGATDPVIAGIADAEIDARMDGLIAEETGKPCPLPIGSTGFHEGDAVDAAYAPAMADRSAWWRPRLREAIDRAESAKGAPLPGTLGVLAATLRMAR